MLFLLQSVPDVLWSALLSSVLTLAGVLVLNRSNTTRLRIQLEHDSGEKQKERTAALRRDVYLRAVEELTKANSKLGSLSQADLTKVNAGDIFQEFFASAAKLQLVAEPGTALLVNRLVADYAEMLLGLLKLLIPVQNARADIAIYDDLYNQAHAERTRVLAEMAKFNEAARNEPVIWGALQRSFDGFSKQANAHGTERSGAWDRFNIATRQFVVAVLGDLRQITAKQIPVLIEIRRDLGLTTDLAVFQEQMQAQAERMANRIEAVIHDLGGG